MREKERYKSNQMKGVEERREREERTENKIVVESMIEMVYVL